MKFTKILVILAAFLIMISSIMILPLTESRMPVYINVAAMIVLAIVIISISTNKNNKK